MCLLKKHVEMGAKINLTCVLLLLRYGTNVGWTFTWKHYAVFVWDVFCR